MKEKLIRADKAIVNFTKYLSYISAVCLVIIMFVAFFNVIGEKLKVAGLPVSGIPNSTEIIQYLHIPVVFLACAYVTFDRGHVNIDLFTSKFSAKVQGILNTVGNLFGAFISGFVGFRGFVQMEKFITRNKMSSVNGEGFPLWPFAAIVGIGFCILSFSFLWCEVRKVIYKDEKNQKDLNGSEDNENVVMEGSES
ncbi:MAG: TRAP transporter small permease [Lachnospirales bacterium]